MHRDSSNDDQQLSTLSLRKLEGIPDLQRRLLLRAGLGLSAGGAAALLAACGGGDDGAVAAQPGATPAPTPTPGNPVVTPPVTLTPADPVVQQPVNTQVASFALAVLPDTQFYSRYATVDENTQFQRKYGSTPFLAQTQWIAANAAALKIPFTAHLGDVVDQVRKPQQWVIADEAIRALETAKQPYSILAGNHDVLSDTDYVNAASQSSNTDAQRTLSAEPYLQNFPTSRAQKQATFGGRDPSGFHEFHIFEAEGNRFMVLSLSWRISDAALAWANKVIADNPTLPVILANHQLINIGPDGVTPLEVPYGLMLWDKLIKGNDQIFMTLNGHYHGAAHLTKTNDFGNKVEQMVVDYQMAYMGGNGLMRLCEFDLTNGKIKVISFSPWVPRKPSATLNDFDVAVLTDASQQFDIAINFKQRFARFNPGFKVPEASNAPINERAKAAILANYVEPSLTTKKPAADENDYPLVASTVAHWRLFGGTPDTVVPVGYVVADKTGNNPIYREALTFNNATIAQEGDMTWSAERHFLSAAPGSVRFANTTTKPLRMSYFTTQSTAAINTATFDTGYTVEAFIKIDATWTATQNSWMNIMERDGRRGQITGFTGGDTDECPIIFAISSLREVQWEVVPNNAGSRSPKSNWSGEIIAGKWIHIAIVNDPALNETIMYVEGAPVLRNTANAPGLAYRQPTDRMVIGGGAYGGNRDNGFLGHIGEIRICAEALAPAKWLTARRG